MIRQLLNLYSPSVVRNLIYMLQASEYDYRRFLKWFWRASDLGKVSHRKGLDKTTKAKLLLNAGYLIYFSLLLLALSFITYSIKNYNLGLTLLGLGVLILAPILLTYLLIVPLVFGHIFIQKPIQNKKIKMAKEIFAHTPAAKIVVLGSYGKTSTKELLKNVLGTKLKVKATSGNKNTALGIAEFAASLDGDEDVLIIELGEYYPGDIKFFLEMVQPDYAVVTGLSEAHIENFGSLEAIAKEFSVVTDYLKPSRIFINTDSPKLNQYLTIKGQAYSSKQVAKAKISNIKTDLEGTSFKLKLADNKTLNIKSKLLGRHNVPTIALVAYLANKFKLNKSQIEKAIKESQPVSNRLEPKTLEGAIVIDDTYNANIDGMEAAIKLVKSQKKPKRKIYITPGLVETGDLKAELHNQLGQLLAPVFDIVILIKNTNTEHIINGLESADFKGEIYLVDDPLGFYNNLGQFVAKGDLVLMQNDLPDVYF